MFRNIEIKAKIDQNFDEFIKLVNKIADGSKCEILNQHDIFYKSPNGRLKLRTIDSNVSLFSKKKF